MNGNASSRCRNCDAPLRGQLYCGSCGQKSGHEVPSLGEFLHEWLHDVFTFDSKLFQTLVPLLTKPGFLTLEYLSGRRARYARPLQLYLMASLGFFLLVAMTGGFNFVVTDKDNSTGLGLSPQDSLSAEKSPPPPVSAPAGSLEVRDLKTRPGGTPVDDPDGTPAGLGPDSTSQPDTADTSRGNLDLPENLKTLPILGKRISRQEERFNTMGGNTFIEESSQEAGRNLPKMVFFLLPVFALILKLLYWRRRRRYLEHMVFGLHIHAYSFVLFIIANLLGLAVFKSLTAVTGYDFEKWDGAFQALANIAVCVYLFIAMRRVYQQGRTKTTLKFLLLLGIYNLILAVSTVVTMAVSALMV